MPAKFANFADSFVAEYFDVGDTSLVLDTGSIDAFPTLGAGDFFLLTLFDGTHDPEIVKVTARSGTTCTVVRAQESTNSRAWAVGSFARQALTAAQVEALFSSESNLEGRVAALEAVTLDPIDSNFLFCHAILGGR